MTPYQLSAAQDMLSRSDAPDVPRPECQEVQASFWDYVDGNCSSELALRIDAHVPSCGLCLRFRRSQERFLTSLALLRGRSPAPARVHRRVREALAAERW